MPFFEILSEGDDTNSYRTVLNEASISDARNNFQSDAKYVGRKITEIKYISSRGEVCDMKVIPESE